MAVRINQDDPYEIVFRCKDASLLFPIMKELIAHDIGYTFLFKPQGSFFDSSITLVIPDYNREKVQFINELCKRLGEEKEK